MQANRRERLDNRTVMTDTLGVSRWVYDLLNRVVEVTDSLGRRLGYSYDPAGNRIALTLPEGEVIWCDCVCLRHYVFSESSGWR